MRNTKQRECIFDIVNGSYDHLNSYQIYCAAREIIPNISLGTVYRNLSYLSENNKIRMIIVDGIIRYDRNVIHDHFICSECNSIIDIPRCDKNIEYVQGNLVIDYDIKYKGICKKCLKEDGNNGIKGK